MLKNLIPAQILKKSSSKGIFFEWGGVGEITLQLFISTSIPLQLMKQNGMLCQSLGGAVIFISWQHFIAPALDLMACLQARGRKD